MAAISSRASHPAYALLHDDANDWTPASGFREQLTRDALLHGKPRSVWIKVCDEVLIPLFGAADPPIKRIAANRETFFISHSLQRFVRFYMIYAAMQPRPGEDAVAVGDKSYRQFIDAITRMLVKGAVNDSQAPVREEG